MTRPDLEELQEHGAVVLRGIFPEADLVRLKTAAEACFESIQADETRERAKLYRFTPFSYSVVLPALLDFGVDSSRSLIAPLEPAGVNAVASQFFGGNPTCNLEQSWVRRRFAPSRAPLHYQPNTWHQDGGLGVAFGPEPNSSIPLTQLLTCWIPLQACRGDCPSLEFVRVRLDTLLHYTELNDALVRQRFPREQFWAPELEIGDGLVFLAGTLHRTYHRPEMQNHRLSVEYRFFPDRAPE